VFKRYVLPSVRAAEERVLAGAPDHEYAPIVGDADFVKASLRFAYGADSQPLNDGLVVGVQTLSGTGACAVVGKLLHRFAKAKVIYVPDPTWGNHINIFCDMGIEVRKYRYLDAETKTTCVSSTGPRARCGLIWLL
jgi:aspartate aminotransferase